MEETDTPASPAGQLARLFGRPTRTRWVAAALAPVGGLALFFAFASRTPAPALPPGVVKQTITTPIGDHSVRVDFYLPSGSGPAPAVVVAHGFSRSRRHMAGWGGLLASNGFITAVPDQPALADPGVNSRALAGLLAQIRTGAIALPVAPNGKTALIGFSMGGLNTLLAAARVPVDAWVGLDPVDMNSLGRKAAASIRHPAAVLLAEPGPWNRHGNARRIIAALPAGAFALRVRAATHLDVESPTDLLGRLACGDTDPARHQVFERYTVAFLRSVLLGDARAAKALNETAADAAVEPLPGGAAPSPHEDDPRPKNRAGESGQRRILHPPAAPCVSRNAFSILRPPASTATL